MANESLQDFDALMDASMDSIDDLPPMGVPPTGHYNLRVNATRETSEESGNEYVRFTYVVEAINEVKEASEEKDAAVDMKFSTNFSPFKKDGTVNEWGIGFLKEACAPFAQHFGTTKMGDTITAIKDVSVAASLVRRINKKDKERYDFNLKDVVVL